MFYRPFAMLLPLLLAACSNASAISPTIVPDTLNQPAGSSTTALPPLIFSGDAQPTTTQAYPTTSTAIRCTSPASLTPSQTEGPFYKAGSPERTSLWAQGMPGTKLIVTGYVLTSDCKPIARAWLDFWQADANGVYDNNGYTLRGHQFSDSSGRYQLTTVVPGLYTGRTEHIHAKAQAPNGPLLTSQLYFPGVAQNQNDSIFDPKLLLAIQETRDTIAATYNFIVSAR